MEPKRQSSNFMRTAGKYLDLAFILPSCVLVGYGIGYGLDHWFGTNYWYIVWLLIGIAAGMRDLIRKIGKFERDIDRESGS